MNLTVEFEETYIQGGSVVSGPKEAKGPLNEFFDFSFDNERASLKTFEDGEIEMIRKSISILIDKCHVRGDEISICFGGDLTDQMAISNQIGSFLPTSFVGVYGACSTSILGLIMACVFTEDYHANYALSFTSSNYGCSERQFRYPVDYGVQKKNTSTITTTGAASVMVGRRKTKIKVNYATIGKVEDVEWKNANDMGTPMAYAAFTTLEAHFKNTFSSPRDYDLILTGDLSRVGSSILEEMFIKENNPLVNHVDAGKLIYGEDKNYFCGGSGCACIGLVGYGYVLDMLAQKKMKKVLLVGTGALHSPTLVNQGKTIPVIAHCIELEVEE